MRKSNLEKLSNLIILQKRTVASLDNSLTQGSFDSAIARWLSNGTLVGLKKGQYLTSKTYEKYKDNFKFRIYLANSLKFPSYVTGETILREKEVLSEATFGITSFTLKLPDIYTNKLGVFSYNKIKQDLYVGYITDYFLDKKIYYASPAKALFDFLYLKSRLLPDRLKGINLVEELRLNLDNFSYQDFAEFRSYANLVPKSKMERIIKNIVKYAPNIKFTTLN